MQTALHIYSLVEQMRSEAIGGKIVATEFYKKERSAYLFIKTDKKRLTLGFVYHPAGSGTFLVPASKIRIETREKPWPIFKLENGVIKNIDQPFLDRLFYLEIEKEGELFKLVVEAIGPNGNLWLLDKNDIRLSTLRKREFAEGEKYIPIPMPDRLDPRTISSEQLTDLFERHKDSLSPVAILEKKLTGFNLTIAREIIKRARWEDINQPGPDDIARLHEAINSICALFASTESGYIFRIAGRIEVYPFKLSSAAEPVEKAKTLSQAVQSMTTMRQSGVAEADEEKTIISAVNRAVKKSIRKKEKIESDIETATDFELYKKYAELLQINLNEIKKGTEVAKLPDIYHPDQPEVEIKLDPAISPAENAEAYFKKYRKGRQGLDLMIRRAEIARAELESLTAIQAELEVNFLKAKAKYASDLETLLPKEGVKREDAVRLPYKEYTLSTGLTIYVGRDGSDNDRTTFDFARPYELWFHAQQCPGSHVVIKFPNKSFEPSKKEIEETAAIAAWHSKARKNLMVPVIYTQRKYVHKPRKAKPGLVSVEREKSVMVEPKEPLS